MVALKLDNSTTKVYLCNQCGTGSLFLFRLVCHILNLANKHGITGIPAYIPTHLNVKACPGKLVPEWHLLPCIAHAAFQLWSQPEVDLFSSSCTNEYQLYYTLEQTLPPGALGLNELNHPWKFQASYVFPPPALIPLVLSIFLVEHVTSQFRLLILVASCWMEGPWLPTVLSMVEDIPHQ